MSLKFIVTGTGRCGTVYLAKFLTSIGLPCCHEGIFDYAEEKTILNRIENPKERILSDCSMGLAFLNKLEEPNIWTDVTTTIADSSYLAALYLDHKLIRDLPVIHVVRNPLEVISSFVLDLNYFLKNQPNKENYYNGNGYEELIWSKLPELSHIQTQLDRACWFYYRWNQIIEDSCKNRPYMRVKIENFDKLELCQFLNGNDNLLSNSFNDIKSNSNRRRKSNISINDISNSFFRNLIIEKTNQYGYELKGMEMNNLSDTLNKLGDIIKELANKVQEKESMDNSEEISEIALQATEDDDNPIVHIPVDDNPIVHIPVIETEFDKLKTYLYSDKWPAAVNAEEICEKDNEQDKNDRAEAIAEVFLGNCKNKKFLDFGCGEGHIAKNATFMNVSMSVGYDIEKTGNLDWEIQTDHLLTTDFEKVKANGPYDIILLYDVLDHAKDPDELLSNVKSVASNTTKIIARNHPWCSRHGAHLYTLLNKAYVHVVFSKAELDDLGLNTAIHTNECIYPLGHYRELFARHNLKILKEDVENDFIESFFKKDLVKDRIFKKWAVSNGKFPEFQMSQSFVLYELNLN